MKVRYGKDVANHSGPESCVGHREVSVEALTGETGRPAIEPRNQESGTPTLLSEAEGYTERGATRQPRSGPARSKTLSMPGSLLHRSWEVSSPPDGISSGAARKARSQNLAIDADEKSDTFVVPRKSSNKRYDYCGDHGGKERSQGEHRPGPRAPDTEPDQLRVDGTERRT